MNVPLRNLSKALREAIEPLIKIQKNAESDDKLILSHILDRLFDAQSITSDLQTSYQTIVDEKNHLAQVLRDREQWSESASSYQAFRLSSGSTVMIPKEGNQRPYAAEWYCKHCFDNKKKSQLQPKTRSIIFMCPSCPSEIWMDSADEEKYNQANKRRPTPPLSFDDGGLKF